MTNQTNEMKEQTSKMAEHRNHLKTITRSLIEQAKAAGRQQFTNNELLRECYNLVGTELDTYEGWQSRGANVQKGQRAYLFWGQPVMSATGYSYTPVQFLFARDQVRTRSTYNGPSHYDMEQMDHSRRFNDWLCN